ncbi:hypothetical protein C8J57DRAFT_1734064 [Mycena rebaudengoi]|nr:hypothetical protein C8J57DRAFT_1734064 [Mycena rebaudengoi]
MKVTTQKPTLVNAVDLLDCIGSESWLYNATYQNATRMPPDGKESIDLGWLSKVMSSRFGKGNNGIRRVEEKTTMEVRAKSNHCHTHVSPIRYLLATFFSSDHHLAATRDQPSTRDAWAWKGKLSYLPPHDNTPDESIGLRESVSSVSPRYSRRVEARTPRYVFPSLSHRNILTKPTAAPPPRRLDALSSHAALLILLSDFPLRPPRISCCPSSRQMLRVRRRHGGVQDVVGRNCASIGRIPQLQPHTTPRVLPHSADCRYLATALKEAALSANSSKSLGAQVIDGPASKPDAFGKFKQAGAEDKIARRKAHVKRTNYLTMNLLCDGGLPPDLVNDPAFRASVDHLDPNNEIVVATTFSSSYIPAEAARVTLISIEELKKHCNLNMGYDGGTTQGKQSIYTYHVTTDRVVHFITANVTHVQVVMLLELFNGYERNPCGFCWDVTGRKSRRNNNFVVRVEVVGKGDEASGFSHTGAHIHKNMMEIMDLIGRDHFSSIGCDSTGNTKLFAFCSAHAAATLTSVLVAGAGTEGEVPQASFTPECEAGLAALNSALTDDSGDSALSDLDDLDMEATIPLRRDGVDITLPFFRDLLTDKPVDGANKVTSLSIWSGTAIDSGGNGTRSGGKISWDEEAEKMVF